MMKKIFNVKNISLIILVGLNCVNESRAQEKSFLFPPLIDESSYTIFKVLIPEIKKSSSEANDHLFKNNNYVSRWISLEKKLKEIDTIKLNNMYWSYVIDSKKKQVIGINLVSNEESSAFIRLKYGSLPFSDKLPITITELTEQFPGLQYIYRASSPFTTIRDKIIEQNIEDKSLKDFNGDTIAYMDHLFFNRDLFYYNKPFNSLLEDIELKEIDYRILKTSKNKIWGVLLKYTRNQIVFVWVKNIEKSNENGEALDEIKGEIVLIEQVNTLEEVARIEKTMKKYKIESKENRDLLKKFYML